MIEIRQTEEVKKWLKGVKAKIAKAKVLTRIERMKEGNYRDVEPIGDGYSGLKIHQGKGYRVYFATRNNEIILLLCGGNKATQ